MSYRMILPFSWARTTSRRYRSSLVTTPTRVSSMRGTCPRRSRTIARSSARDFPQSSLTQCSRGIRQRQTPKSQWRRRCWTASRDSSRRRSLTARAASRVSDVYMYRFSRVAPSSRSAWGGAAHTSEVPYVFDNTSGDASQFEEIDRTVSGAMADAWVRFAKTGNPNGGGLPQWPAYRSPDYRLLDFGDAVTVRSNARSPEIEFFQRAFETMRRKPSVPKPSAK